MSVMDAAINVAEDYPGGASALARAIDKNHWSFLHELKGVGSAKLGLLTAVKMTRRTDDLRILQAFCAEFGQMCVPLPVSVEHSSDECMQAVGSLVRESSDVVQELVKSLGEDGEINDNELERIQRECGELIASVHKLQLAAAARNHRGHHAAHLEQRQAVR